MSPQQSIAHYKILSKLGEGGMGAVYRATDTKLHRDVAIKVLPDAFAADPDRLARFTREAQVLASLNHPNIAAIYGVEDRALIMELVEGDELKGPLPIDTALAYARQIAEALEAAHDKGIIHRDLKPGNIMITPEGSVKVLDFGLAAIAQPASSDSSANSRTLTMAATQAGVIMGTPAYMSPEQAVGKPVDKRADIWAFGAVLLEMLTGKPVFHGETVSHILADVIRAEIDFTTLPATTPQDVRDLLRRCLDRDVKNRLRDIGEARIAIRNYLTNPVREKPPAARSKGSKWPWAIACAAILGAAVWTGLHRPAPATAAAYNLEVSPPDGEAIYQDAPSGIQAISPDGRTLAFLAGSNGTRHIWLRPLDSPVARSLAGTELADGIFWSPDSRHLGFMAGNKLYRVDLGSGAIKELCDAGYAVRGASWKSGGVILFASVYGPMRRVPADGGTPVPVNAIDRSEINNMYPRFLPDGKQFLYWSRGISADLSGVYAGTLDLPADRQPRKKILSSHSSALFAAAAGRSTGYLLFRQGTTVFAQPFDPQGLTLSGTPHPITDRVGVRDGLGEYSVSANGILATASAGDLSRSVSIVSPRGDIIFTAGKPDSYGALRLSPDGHSVALTKRLPNATIEIWLMDLLHGTPVPFTTNAGSSIFPVWSPGGDELWYSVFRDGLYRMYRKSVSGSGREELAASSDQNQYPADSIRTPPGIVYWTRPAARIEVLPPTANSKPTVIVDDSSSMFGPRVSPSGRWVAYSSDLSGGFEVFVRSMPEGGRPAGPKIRISTAGGANAAWSADGNTLFYNAPDNRLYSVQLKISGDRLEAGDPKLMFPLGGSSGFPGAIYWEPMGNGERFVVLRSSPPTGRDNRIDVLLNWQAGLTK